MEITANSNSSESPEQYVVTISGMVRQLIEKFPTCMVFRHISQDKKIMHCGLGFITDDICICTLFGTVHVASNAGPLLRDVHESII